MLVCVCLCLRGRDAGWHVITFLICSCKLFSKLSEERQYIPQTKSGFFSTDDYERPFISF